MKGLAKKFPSYIHFIIAGLLLLGTIIVFTLRINKLKTKIKELDDKIEDNTIKYDKYLKTTNKKLDMILILLNSPKFDKSNINLDTINEIETSSVESIENIENDSNLDKELESELNDLVSVHHDDNTSESSIVSGLSNISNNINNFNENYTQNDNKKDEMRRQQEEEMRRQQEEESNDSSDQEQESSDDEEQYSSSDDGEGEDSDDNEDDIVNNLLSNNNGNIEAALIEVTST